MFTLLTLPFAISDIDIGVDESDNPIVVMQTSDAPTNFSIRNVNSSNFWGIYLYSDYDMPTIKLFGYNQSLYSDESFVPYIGATKNVFLGNFNLTASSIGLGVSNPASVLHINQTINSTNTAYGVGLHIGSGNGVGLSASSGIQPFVKLTPNIMHSGTAGYTALMINVTEAGGFPSGEKSLIRAFVSSDIIPEKFRLDDQGDIYIGGGDLYSPRSNLRLNANRSVFISMDYDTNDNDNSGDVFIAFGKNDEGGNTNWTELMRVQQNGSVGIGTKTPTVKLEVNGSIKITGDTNITGDLYVEGTSYLGDVIVNADNITTNNIISKDGNLSFWNSTNDEIIIFTEEGRIGGGTTTPNSSLHFSSEIGNVGIILDADIKNNNESSNPFIKMSQDGRTVSVIMGATGANDEDPEGNTYTGTITNDFLLGTTFEFSGFNFGTNRIVQARIHPQGSFNIYKNLSIGTNLRARQGADLMVLVTQGGTGTSDVASFDHQVDIGGPFNVGPNGANGVKLWIGDYSNDGELVYPIYVEDENNGVDFWLKSRPSGAGQSTAYFQGRVGIGATEPTHLLEVRGVTGGTPPLRTVGTAGGAQFRMTEASSFGNIDFSVGTGPKLGIIGGPVGIGALQGSHTLGVTGDANISTNLDVGGNFTGNQFYAEMWFSNDTATGVTTTITTQSVWVNITGFNQSSGSGRELNGFIFNNTREHLKVVVPGLYNCRYDISTGNVGNNQEYNFVIAIDSIPQNKTKAHRKIGSSGDVGNAGEGGFLDLNVGDDITLMTSNMDGISDLYVHSAGINCMRIGT